MIKQGGSSVIFLCYGVSSTNNWPGMNTRGPGSLHGPRTSRTYFGHRGNPVVACAGITQERGFPTKLISVRQVGAIPPGDTTKGWEVYTLLVRYTGRLPPVDQLLFLDLSLIPFPETYALRP